MTHGMPGVGVHPGLGDLLGAGDTVPVGDPDGDLPTDPEGGGRNPLWLHGDLMATDRPELDRDGRIIHVPEVT